VPGDSGERIRFKVLGPMRITDGAQTRPVAGARQRIVLSALLERANQSVPARQLAEIVWDGEPPDSAVPTLRTYLMRLRRSLGPRAGARILTKDNGYVAQVEEDELDALLFEARCRRTDTAARAGVWPQVAEAAESALDLWQGTPLVDVPCQTLHETWLPRLEQMELQVREWHTEAALHLGRNEQLIQPLRDLTAAHPLRERFHAQLMLALYRTGRQAEALAAYQNARRGLVETLGIEPGAELRSLHARILADEAEPPPLTQPVIELTSTKESAQTVAGTGTRAAPRQLPAAARHFTGRQAELDLLVNQLEPSQTAEFGATVVISAIDGMAGIGKTALAIHAAHRLAGRFPDGQLFLDLHGHTQGHRPRTADEALDWLLRALGVPPEGIPADGEQAAALYRQRLAGTRTLIVLDNAATEAQVRPLLPAADSCLVLVTSRRRLKALDDARTVALDLLSPPDAVALLRAVAGPGRIPADDPLTDELAELCGYLPLALRIAASLLRHRPTWPLGHLVGTLRDQHRRVAALYDTERELAAVFDLSYADLDEQDRRLWRRLGLVPGPDLDAYAAAALMQVDPVTVTGLLEDLVDHNLLGAYAPGRYRLHDLMRVHARTLAAADPAPEREAAQDRLLYYYARTAQSASASIARSPRPQPDDPAPAHTPVLPDPESARTWLRDELLNLEAAFTHAHTHGLGGHTVALAAGLAETLLADGPFTHALAVQQTAAETAERLGHSAAHANALTDLGSVRYLTGDYAGADKTLTRALEMHRALGNGLGEANALSDLGRVRYLTGDYAGAGDAHTQALEIYLALGLSLGEANSLTNLGRVRTLTGDYAGAGDALARALEIYRDLDHQHGEAYALTYLGSVRTVTGDYPEAVDALSRALEIYRVRDHRHGEANALTDLGRIWTSIGDYPKADGLLTQALEIYLSLGHRHGEADALTELGNARYLAEDYPGAGDALARALEIYRAIGHRHGEADALTDLGRVRYLTGDYAEADKALTRALEIYRALGHRSNESWALNYYAATLAATGRRPRALELYRRALAMNRELNKPDDEALSLEGIAEHHLATGDPARGAAHLQQALEIYQRLGMIPDTRRVQNQLNELTA
jgi:DNA-binding SARP family transcriptional activator